MPIRERGDLRARASGRGALQIWAILAPFCHGGKREGDKTPYRIVYRVTQRFYFMGHNAILFDISLTIIMSLVWGTKLMVQFVIEYH